MPMDAEEKNEAFEKCGQIGRDAMTNLESWLTDWHATTMALFSNQILTPIPPDCRGDTRAARDIWEDAGAPAQGGLMERALLEQLNVGRLWDAIQDEDFEAIEDWQWRADKSFFTKENIAEIWTMMVEGLPDDLRGQYEISASGPDSGSGGHEQQIEDKKEGLAGDDGQKESSKGNGST